ncbi:hypothetical protein FGO68_gene771 [Halteria grandinella]|uniref:Transmembrane protein n=1 Tax=Halteria grandinella TaxID=5974 RepID=A0A8J8NVV8_HALGN|nr:hypothetical protein FGO68_gene771 [Halteria grandinella]
MKALTLQLIENGRLMFAYQNQGYLIQLKLDQNCNIQIENLSIPCSFLHYIRFSLYSTLYIVHLYLQKIYLFLGIALYLVHYGTVWHHQFYAHLYQNLQFNFSHQLICP